MEQYNTQIINCQSSDENIMDDPYWQYTHKLVDKSSTGKDRKWAQRKVANEYLAMAYDDINKKKAIRLRDCCTMLQFKLDFDNSLMKLIFATSCRVRLCPLCSWRRSLKNYYNTKKIIDYLQNDDRSIRYIFLTLTVKNCNGSVLSDILDLLFTAVKRLYQKKEVKSKVLGMVRNLEITHNVNVKSKDYDTYHPHFHCIIAVKTTYFKKNEYITQARWAEMWKDCLRVNYTPIVDVRVVKPKADSRGVLSISSAVAECSKYAAKDKDYIIYDDWDLTVDTVKILDSALNGRRLINYSGIFRTVMNFLKLEDPEHGDLVNVGEEESEVLGDNTYEVTYFWFSGYRQYFRFD